jgi:hypothetical protein
MVLPRLGKQDPKGKKIVAAEVVERWMQSSNGINRPVGEQKYRWAQVAAMGKPAIGGS